ncbi:MAG: hypothetical protein AVDCRST_MAG18-746 [uncultured Thermomicrobiales bacterium]|uniref:Methyltransferase type 11 domain-containing protein n=1 Tax=uncultured Thermomicrobiales bacterium TaxID=1645740 RepID=A0A6J4USN4_9BACT|nr:MAG: hypothetical protein AVDCRST_MAG18-746 [uncultured Thermomicrobiales bacterium]
MTPLEPSAELAARAERLLGRPVLRPTLQELAFDGASDGIWACASLLHVPRAELDGALARLARALVPGGAVPVVQVRRGGGCAQRAPVQRSGKRRGSSRHWRSPS